MKLQAFYNGERKTFDLNFGIKLGYSPYILCEHDSPRDLNSVIDILTEPDIEAAVKKAILTDYFNDNGYINVITGDGQVIRVEGD